METLAFIFFTLGLSRLSTLGQDYLICTAPGTAERGSLQLPGYSEIAPCWVPLQNHSWTRLITIKFMQDSEPALILWWKALGLPWFLTQTQHIFGNWVWMFALFNRDSSHGTRGAAGGEPTGPDDGIKFHIKRNKGLWKSLITKPHYIQPPTSVIRSSLDRRERPLLSPKDMSGFIQNDLNILLIQGFLCLVFHLKII